MSNVIPFNRTGAKIDGLKSALRKGPPYVEFAHVKGSVRMVVADFEFCLTISEARELAECLADTAADADCWEDPE